MENLKLTDGDVLALIAVLEKITDGRVSIFRRETGWKVVLGTPELVDSGLLIGPPSGMSLPEALAHAIVTAAKR